MALTAYEAFTTSGAINAKGAYVQIVAATPYASSRLHFTIVSSGASAPFYLIDVATGAAGSEVVIAGNIAVMTSAFLIREFITISVDIPNGSRLSVRTQASAAGQTMSSGWLLEDRPLATLANPVTYGAVTAASRGTQIDPGAVVSTKGAYVEFTASTITRIDRLAICATMAQAGTSIGSFQSWHLDIATGAAGAETVIIPNLVYPGLSNIMGPGIVELPVSIPAGTRLSARCDCSRNTAIERLLSVTLIGMQEPPASGAILSGKHYPQDATNNYITYPVATVTGSNVPITPSASANVKGAFVEITPTTPFACNSIRVGLSGSVNNTQTWLLDIALGAAGAETVIISNLMSDQFTTGSSIGNMGWHEILVAIPAGSRISARCQCSTGSRVLGIYLVLTNAGDTPGISPTNFITYGANTAGSRGTNVDPGGVANTKGSYVEITPSTSNLIQWMMVNLGHAGITGPNGQSWVFDIATGPAGSEVVLFPDLRIQNPGTSPGVLAPRSYSFLTYIPAGTRIAARCQSDLTTVATSPGRTMDVLLVTATAPPESAGGGSGGNVAYIG